MPKIKEVEVLNRKIKNCRKCSLYKSANKAVPGEGSLNAKLMFIGQSPGREEDKTGKPFAGRAGKFLDYLLEKNKIKSTKMMRTLEISFLGFLVLWGAGISIIDQ